MAERQRQEKPGTEGGGKGDSSICWTCGKADTSQLQQELAMGDKESETVENLQACCLLEESEHEQWQEVISRKDTKTEESCACLTAECGRQSRFDSQEHNPSEERTSKGQGPKRFWTCRTVTPKGMFPHVKLERNSAPKKFVAADGEQIRELGVETIPLDK